MMTLTDVWFLAGGFVLGALMMLIWHWYAMAYWANQIRKANKGRIPGYDDIDDEEER